jgi:hypothetical protein
VHLESIGIPSHLTTGEAVAGVVRVRLDERADVDVRVWPRITLHYKDHLKGSARRDGVVVHQGPLEAGTHDLQFELPIPVTPASFSGEIVQIEWAVEATANDAGGMMPVTLQRDRERAIWVAPNHAFGTHADLEEGGLGCVIALAVLTLALVVGAVAGWYAGEQDLWMTLALFAVGSALLLWGMIRNYRTGAVVGTPELTTQAVTVEPGRPVTLPVSLTHKSGAPVESVEATLAVLEYARHDSSHPFGERTIWSRTERLDRARDGEWSGAIELPAPGEVPCSYVVNDEAQIRWVLRAQLSGEAFHDDQAHTTLWLVAAPVASTADRSRVRP